MQDSPNKDRFYMNKTDWKPFDNGILVSIREVRHFNTTTMKRSKKPTEKTEQKKNKRSSPTRQRENHDEFQRTIPGRRSPVIEKGKERIVNEDEQLKVVNYREDNAQSPAGSMPDHENPPSSPRENENERLEAGNDNNEVHPRSPKVN
jgi:hypothetical protein